MTTLVLAVLTIAIIAGGLFGFTAYAARRVERAFPPRGRFLDLDGERIHYVDEGAGPPLFLIHGLAGQVGNFTYALVGRLAKDFRVIAVDRPGSGYSTRRVGADARLRAQGRALVKVITALNLDRPLVVGHSMGGAVALAIALDHPERISGLALIAPITHVVEAPPPAFRGLDIRSPLLRRIVAWTIAAPAAILAGGWALKEVFAPEKVPADFITLGGGALGLRPQNFYATSTDMESITDGFDAMTQCYPTLAIPIGILFGRDDRILDWRAHGQAMKAKLPGLDLELIDGGHMLPVTAPDTAAAFIRRMAAKASLRSAHEPGKTLERRSLRDGA